jgi:O-acetylhomoserine (thiol)-lyase
MGFTTNVIHTEFGKADPHSAAHMPIYSNAAFSFETAEQMELAFRGLSPDHTYSRISNPTVENFEQRVRAVTGAQFVTALSSGMAAISNAIITIAQAGDNIITSKHIFSNTYILFSSTLKALGVEFRFCDLTNPDDIRRNIDPNTVAIFFETITNPQLEVADISKLSAIAKENRLVLIADSTITPPNIFQAGKAGVNIEVISSTKIISGGATSVGGLIIDHGNFDWKNNRRLADFYKRFGPLAFNARLRKEVLRNLGACLSPYHAYFQSLGLETLALRYDKAAANCLQLAKFFETETKIVAVNYPGLESSPAHSLATKQFGKLPGAILTFQLESREASFRFLNKLKLIVRATNIYDNRTLIIHPASTIYGDYTPELRNSLSVPDSLIRLSLGIEDAEDLISDIQQALNN